MGGWWVYLDYRVSSGPFLRFSMSFEFLSEMLDHSVSETRDPSLTIVLRCQHHLSVALLEGEGVKENFATTTGVTRSFTTDRRLTSVERSSTGKLWSPMMVLNLYNLFEL